MADSIAEKPQVVEPVKTEATKETPIGKPGQKGAPAFLRNFSKQTAEEERKTTAAHLREVRKKIDLQEQLSVLKAQINMEDGKPQASEVLPKITALKSLLASIETDDPRQPQEILADFYKQQAKRWQEQGYEQADMREHFSEEHLASLSLDDYTLLLRRYPNEMVTHVTRQGIRDHIGMSEHTLGQGEFSNGFMQLLQEGRIRPALSLMMKDEMRKDLFRKYLELNPNKDKEASIRYVERLLHPRYGKIGDTLAVHVAVENVLDYFYGSERQNEIFFVFPAAHIASQFYFYRTLTESSPSQHNDVYVWANADKGLNVNAGIVFIPQDARVGRTTGSRYEMDSNGKPVVQTDRVDQMEALVANKEFKSFVAEAFPVVTNEPPGQRRDEQIARFRTRLRDEFHLYDEGMQDVVLNHAKGSLAGYYKTAEVVERDNMIIDKKLAKQPKNAVKLEADKTKAIAYLRNQRMLLSSDIARGLREEGLYYEPARDTVSSYEFWEQYFADRPGQRPNKIVYYAGGDPTQALRSFKEMHGLKKRSRESDHLGFSEHRKMYTDIPEEAKGKTGLQTIEAEFRQKAMEEIEDYYAELDSKAAVQEAA